MSRLLSAAQLAYRLRRQLWLWTAAVAGLCAVSCRHPQGELHYLTRARPADYIAHASQIAYPDLNEPLSPNVNFAAAPRTLRREEKDELWDLTLAECIHIALSNSQVLRNSANFLSPQNPLLNSPDFVPSTFDPAIQQSGVLFGQRGVEAALADFDTQFTTQMLWGRNELVQNNTLSLGLPAGSVLVDETAAFSSGFQKRFGTGGQIALNHNMNYTGRNIGVPPQLFHSVYEGNVQLQFRQPLLAGGGTEYTRIAGPISTNIQGVTGVQQGVIIARIANDMKLAEFDQDVQRLVHDVEALYWQLHLAYCAWAIQVDVRNDALDAWRRVNSQQQARTGLGGAQEADLRGMYFAMKDQADQTRDSLYAAEAQLRLLMGLPVNDGRVIRPIDHPIAAEVLPDWAASLADALFHRAEIRKQKWNIRSLQLQCKAAENLLLPRLDFVSGYQVNGFGDDLLDIGGGTPAGRYPGAYEDLWSADKTGWNLGVEFSVPLGRRFAHAQVRTLELRLAKAQALLKEQEVEISHEIAAAFRDIDRNYIATVTSLTRFRASQDATQIAKAQYESDPLRYSLDTVMQARQSLAQAELALVSAVVQYTQSLSDLSYRCGKALQLNNILLMEEGWDAEAYHDAGRRYQERMHAKPAKRLHDVAPLSDAP